MVPCEIQGYLSLGTGNANGNLYAGGSLTITAGNGSASFSTGQIVAFSPSGQPALATGSTNTTTGTIWVFATATTIGSSVYWTASTAPIQEPEPRPRLWNARILKGSLRLYEPKS